MPYPVDHLIEKQGTIVTVWKSDPINEALDRMLEHDFSQLPVVGHGDHLKGMVTFE